MGTAPGHPGRGAAGAAGAWRRPVRSHSGVAPTRLVAFVPRTHTDAVPEAMRTHPRGREAAVIGGCVAEHPGMVVARTGIGATRIVDPPVGEQLPRIC